MRRTFFSLAICGALTACGGGLPDVAKFAAPKAIESHAGGPANATPGTCWALDRTPAKIETIVEKILVTPGEYAHDGIVLREEEYRTEVEERIVEEGENLWFQTPCDDDMTADFITSLQRALAARGHYMGEIHGLMDGPTKRAVREFQQPLGLNSQVLSLAAAEQLGLVAVSAARERAEVDAAAPPAPLTERPIVTDEQVAAIPDTPIVEQRPLERSLY